MQKDHSENEATEMKWLQWASLVIKPESIIIEVICKILKTITNQNGTVSLAYPFMYVDIWELN